MRKTFFLLLLATSFYSLSAPNANAIVCSNCSQLAVQIIEKLVQGYELAKETITASATGVTAVNQQLDTVNNTVLKPMRDALTVITVLKSGDNVRNLILGSAGVDPLLVDDPQKYFRGKALETVNANLAASGLSQISGNESIMKSVLSSIKYEYSSTSQKIRMLGQSPVLSTIQRNACTDAALTRLAREDVSVPGQPINTAAFNARKQELYSALCVHNPLDDTAGGRATASALQRLNQSRPEIGGWDSWLATISGDNPYTRDAMIMLALQEEVDRKVAQAENDLQAGGGIRSLTECTSRTTTGVDGFPYANGSQAPCVQESIKQVGSILNQSFKDAISAPLDLLKHSFGSGAGQLINTAFTTVNLLKGIDTALNGLNTGGSGGNNVPTPTSASIPPVNDLANNPSAKENLTSTPRRQLLEHQTGLTALESTNQKFYSELENHQNQLNTMKSCFDGLPAGTNGAGAGTTYFNTRKATIDALTQKLNNEKTAIQTTRRILTETIDNITRSNSSEQILGYFNTYQNLMTTQNLPGAMAAAAREAEYVNFKAEAEQLVSEGGQIYNLNQQCTTLKMQQQSSQVVS